MELSKKSLEMLKQLFSESSNLQLPVGFAEQALEIRNYVNEHILLRNDPEEKR